MTEERANRLLRKCKELRLLHLAPTEEINIMEGTIHSNCDSATSNRYTAALVEAEAHASLLPSGRDEDGQEWIEIDGKRWPRDWFIRTCARMKAEGTI